MTENGIIVMFCQYCCNRNNHDSGSFFMFALTIDYGCFEQAVIIITGSLYSPTIYSYVCIDHRLWMF